jgi:hypothetical protein
MFKQYSLHIYPMNVLAWNGDATRNVNILAQKPAAASIYKPRDTYLGRVLVHLTSYGRT